MVRGPRRRCYQLLWLSNWFVIPPFSLLLLSPLTGSGELATNIFSLGPFEVESTLKQHPAVAECAVISSPDMVRGEVVKAFIVLTSKYAKAPRDQLTKELQIFCKTNSAPYKYPRKVAFVNQESLPRTTSGKIKRAELRKLEWQNAKSENLPKL